MVTDKLGSYGAAKKEIMPGVEHRQHKGLNNRAENSHQPTRRRERQRKRFKSARHVQRFVSIHGPIANLFYLHRDHVTASEYRGARLRAFGVWPDITRVAAAACLSVGCCRDQLTCLPERQQLDGAPGSPRQSLTDLVAGNVRPDDHVSPTGVMLRS